MSFHESLNAWLSGYLAVPVIAAYQAGPRPLSPYVMTNVTGEAMVREQPRDLQFRAAEVESITDIEYRVSVHAYGPDPRATLRPLMGAKHLTQALEPMRPYRLHEVGTIEFVPEMVKAEWEPRAIVRLIWFGLHRETRPGDVADQVAITVEENT